MRRRVIIGAAVAAAAIVTGTGIGVTTGTGGDDERPLAGSDRQRAIAAALEHTGGGTVTEIEVGDGGAAYGVEVRRPDGGEVEVSLDERFLVVGEEADDDGRTTTDVRPCAPAAGGSTASPTGRAPRGGCR